MELTVQVAGVARNFDWGWHKMEKYVT